jgi:preprotein translocase subunit SecD
LRSGALPAAIEVVQQRIVEASLGADSIRHGLQAGAAGLGAVVAAMLLYYRWAGANATLALFLNGVLLIAALACFGAVLTLPGIAGMVLTIGMAVDSNVLIFERIREELRAGKSAAAALAAGFSKAFATLVDTHVTTVVSCAFLFFFGTPAVKGFAATLVIGLTTNLFTSVFVSRVAFDWELSKRRRTAELSIGMAR